MHRFWIVVVGVISNLYLWICDDRFEVNNSLQIGHGVDAICLWRFIDNVVHTMIIAQTIFIISYTHLMTIHSILLDITHILIPIVIIIIALIPTCFFIISQQQEGLVSRLGRYTGTPKPLVCILKIPLIDRLDAKISKALQSIHANLDTKPLMISLLHCQFQFSLMCAIVQNTTTTTSIQASKLRILSLLRYANTLLQNFQHLYDERQEISESVIDGVKQELLDYGVEVIRIIIDEPQPDFAHQTSIQ